MGIWVIVSEGWYKTLPRHAGDLAAIGQTLGEDGELPLWSCETGAGARGVCRCGGGRRER